VKVIATDTTGACNSFTFGSGGRRRRFALLRFVSASCRRLRAGDREAIFTSQPT